MARECCDCDSGWHNCRKDGNLYLLQTTSAGMCGFVAGMTFTSLLTYHMGRVPNSKDVSSAQPLDSTNVGEHAYKPPKYI